MLGTVATHSKQKTSTASHYRIKDICFKCHTAMLQVGMLCNLNRGIAHLMYSLVFFFLYTWAV